MTESMEKKFSELKMTSEEMERFTEAMKKEEFRKLLIEYAEELADPKNREQYEKEISMLEEERGNNVLFIHPEPGFCMKTTQNGEKKCFINICKNENVNKPSSSREVSRNKAGLVWSIPHTCAPPREDVDQSNNKQCIVYDVVFHPDAYRMAETNQAFNTLIRDSALDTIEKNFNVKLDRVNAKVLKNLKFKGRPTAAVIRKPLETTNNNSTNLTKKENSNDPIDSIIDKLKEDYLKTQSENKVKVNTSKEVNYLSEKEANKFTVPKYKILNRGQVDLQDCVLDSRFVTSTRPSEIFLSIELPLCKSSANVNLDIFEKRLLLESAEPSYKLDLTLSYPVKEKEAKAKFDKSKRILNVTLPVVPFIAKLDESNDSALYLSDDSVSSSHSSLNETTPQLTHPSLPSEDVKLNVPSHVEIKETRTSVTFRFTIVNYLKSTIELCFNSESELSLKCEACNLSSGYSMFYFVNVSLFMKRGDAKDPFSFVFGDLLEKCKEFRKVEESEGFSVRFVSDELFEIVVWKREASEGEVEKKLALVWLEDNESLVEVEIVDGDEKSGEDQTCDLNGMSTKEFILGFDKNLSRNVELDEDDDENEEDEEKMVKNSLVEKLLSAKNGEEKLLGKKSNSEELGEEEEDDDELEQQAAFSLNKQNDEDDDDSYEKEYIKIEQSKQGEVKLKENDEKSDDEEKLDKINDAFSFSSSSTNFTLSSSSLSSSMGRLKGILKKPRSVSESESGSHSLSHRNSLPDNLQSDENSNSDENISSFKKSVSFNKQVVKNIFKPGSTVVGMKKPNSSKNKKKNKRKRTISDPSHNGSDGGLADDAGRFRSRSISESSDDFSSGAGAMTDSIENLPDEADKSNEQKKNKNKNKNKKGNSKNGGKKAPESKFMTVEDFKREKSEKSQQQTTTTTTANIGKSPLDVETMLKWKAQGKMPHEEIAPKTQPIQIKFKNKIINDLD